MAGTYTEGVHKDLSGVYSMIVTAVESSDFGQRGIVTYPFTAEWGPVNTLEDIQDETSFKDLFFAESTDLTAGKIFTHAFKGKPSLVLGYRMALDTAKKGEATLPTGWVLETLYPSARAFTAKVTDTLSGGVVVEILEAGKPLVKVEAGTVDELETAINYTSYVRVKTKGTALPAASAGIAFEGGSNGEAVTGTEYMTYREVVEADGRAQSIALDNYEDPANVAATAAWHKRVREEGVYLKFVNGGPLIWDTNVDTANGVSKEHNDRAVINVGNGVDGFKASDMAIFIAARSASVALNRTLTDENVPYDMVNVKLTKAQRIAAKKAGTLVFIQKGKIVQIDEAINTFTKVTDPERQKLEFGKIRVSNTLDQITTDLEVFGDEYKKTRSNTPEARETYAAAVESVYLEPLVSEEVLKPGVTYRPDLEYHGSNSTKVAKLDEAYFVSGIQPVDSMEKIYEKIGVSF